MEEDKIILENKVKLSVIIITKNEEKNIERCLKSVKWADEIIVVDSYSTDNTLSIVKRYTDKIYQNKWSGYANQRNFGAGQASNDWVLCIDSDEVVTINLSMEIKKTLRNNVHYNGYFIPMKNCMFDYWMKYSGLNRQYHLRLYNKLKGKWIKDIHEIVKINGKIGCLKNIILHYAYNSISDLVKKMDIYTDLEAKALYEKNIKFSKWKAIKNPIIIFIYKYIFQRGFLDGSPGLIWAVSLGYYNFLKWQKVWEMYAKDEGGKGK